tara:strand:+ start:1277 stop:1528 length:252 start_codon:yes stop_codon:yes gene_type:complete
MSFITGKIIVAQTQLNNSQTHSASISSVEKFKEYMEKTPQEILFEEFLKRHKLTEEEFMQLSSDEKESLFKKFEDELKQKAGV